MDSCKYVDEIRVMVLDYRGKPFNQFNEAEREDLYEDALDPLCLLTNPCVGYNDDSLEVIIPLDYMVRLTDSDAAEAFLSRIAKHLRNDLQDFRMTVEHGPWVIKPSRSLCLDPEEYLADFELQFVV